MQYLCGVAVAVASYVKAAKAATKLRTREDIQVELVRLEKQIEALKRELQNLS